MERPFSQFEPRITPASDTEFAEVSHICHDVRGAFEKALHGDGVGVVYPLGINLETRQHMHEQVVDAFIEGAAQQKEGTKIQYLSGFEPEIFEPLFSMCLEENDSLSEPMIAANLMYMMYPPGAWLAGHYDFENGAVADAGHLPEESITIVYVTAGSKRLGVETPGASIVEGELPKHAISQQADMLVVFRGGTLMDGEQVRKAIWHWVPELRNDEISASVTFDLMPKSKMVEKD